MNTQALFMSLDGVVEGPGPSDNCVRAGWMMPYFSPELGAFIGESAAQSHQHAVPQATNDWKSG